MNLLPLFAVALLALTGAYLSFHESHRRAWYTFPALMLLSCLMGLLWAYAIRQATAKEDVWLLSLWWDVIVLTAYAVVPCVAFGVELTRGQVIGGALIVAGLVIAKAGSGI